jgi:hypothetical protein
MIHPPHGYAHIFNYELEKGTNSPKLIVRYNDVIFQTNGVSNYNSSGFVNKILEKVLSDFNKEGSLYTNVQLKKSSLKFIWKNQTYSTSNYTDNKLQIKLHPSEDTAHLFIDELNIMAAFKNEISYIKQGLFIKKNFTLEENYSKSIVIPQHGLQISLNHCSSYNQFKSIIISCLYKDISTNMINELKKLHLSKWNIDLNESNLDIENIIKDNMEILIA